MTLKEQLAADLKDAMRARDETRRLTLRAALAAIRTAEDSAVQSRIAAGAKAAGAGPDDAVERIQVQLTDDDLRQVLSRQIKQRRDSIEQFSKAGRQELVDIESAEIAVLQTYLPQTLGREAIEAEARAVIAETGASGPTDKAKVMPLLIKRLAGRAEGREINAVVTELLR